VLKLRELGELIQPKLTILIFTSFRGPKALSDKAERPTQSSYTGSRREVHAA